MDKDRFVEIERFRKAGQSPYFRAVGGDEPLDDGKIVDVFSLHDDSKVYRNMQLCILPDPETKVLQLSVTDASDQQINKPVWVGKPLSNADLVYLRFDLSNRD